MAVTYMAHFHQDLSEKYQMILLESSGLMNALMSGYVDYNRQLTRLLAMRMRYNEATDRFEMNKKALEEDRDRVKVKTR